MKNYRLHYSKIGSEDIPFFDFKKHKDMLEFIDEKCFGRNGQVVWLLVKKDCTDIFISESYLNIQFFLAKMYLWQTVGEYHLQEYKSFKEAYSVALMMNEISPLCY